ncbi:MAG TPA: Dabb family protein [Gemmataceae bacterium]|nr:Dabb family protein [Gemmataceae bacterium]
MKKLLIFGFVLLLALTGIHVVQSAEEKRVSDESGPMISHDVYFTLKQNSPESRKKLVDACTKYLTHHPGATFFAAGSRDPAFNRDVNVKDWDVGLHVVFKNKAAHDKYQSSERHQQFIKENRENWQKVQVFDTQFEE